jgi:hypothetical protein
MSSTPPVAAPDPDTILTTVYCLVDDLYRDQHWAARVRPRRPGQFQPTVSDSEVLTLMLLEQWQPDCSERAFLRYVATHWRASFPRQLSQSAFNRRARDLWGCLAALGPGLAEAIASALALPHDAYEVIDAVPVPLARRCRGHHHRLNGLVAAYGRGGADHAPYFGAKLLLSVSPTPLIRGALAGPANTEERWLLDGLLTWRWDPTLPLATPADLASVLAWPHRHHGQRVGPTGWLGPRYATGVPIAAPLYGDLNYAGERWQQHWRDAYGQRVVTKADVRAHAQATAADVRHFNGVRQVVERVNGLLEALFGLTFPRARTVTGLWARLGAKVAACNCLVYLNLRAGRAAEQHCSPLV